MKSFETCRITTSDYDKSHNMAEDQPTEKSQVLLDESNENLEIVPMPTLEDEVVDESEVFIIVNVEDLTEKILEESEIEIMRID